MTNRINISSGTTWESTVGYSRAVRVGDLVFVAGTTAVDDEGRIVAPGDPHGQAAFILKKIARALGQAGASIGDVVRTRMYVIDMDDQEAVGRAHLETFEEILPAATMVEVSALADPELLVEIEVDAVVDSGS